MSGGERWLTAASVSVITDPRLDLTGRAAIVTGGTKGLGRVIATTLLAAGADVLVVARTTPDELPRAGEHEARNPWVKSGSE